MQGLQRERPGVVEGVGFAVVGGGAGEAEGEEVGERVDGLEEGGEGEGFGD